MIVINNNNNNNNNSSKCSWKAYCVLGTGLGDLCE